MFEIDPEFKKSLEYIEYHLTNVNQVCAPDEFILRQRKLLISLAEAFMVIKKNIEPHVRESNTDLLRDKEAS